MSKVFDGMMEAFKELGAIEGYSEDFFNLIDDCIEENKEESLTEALEDYKITYYLSTATAERRPETIEDVENDWKEETFAADSDYDALLYALELIDNGYDDTDFSTAEEIIQYFDEKDLGDGSPFVVKLEGPNGVIYDMGQTKDDFIEQVKQNDEILAYYRKVLGIDESLNEATIHMAKREMAKLDQEVEEATKEVAKYNIPMISRKNSAGEIINIPDFDSVPENHRAAAKKAYDRYKKALEARPNRAKNIIAYDESINNENLDILNVEKDDNKMNEDMSVRAKLKALYPELNFSDNVKEAINEATDSKVTLEVMFEEYKRYDVGATRKAKVSGKDLLSALKKMVDRMGLYITSDDIEEENLSAEEVIDRIEEANGDGCDFIFYIKNLTTGEMLLQDSYEDEEDWDDEELDDDTEFDIDESHETRLMSSLYEGSDDFDEYDDEAYEELDEAVSKVPESDEGRGKYIWKISFDTASGEYEATNDVDDIYAHGATLKDCIEDLKSLVNELGEMDGSAAVKKFSDKHVDYSESDLDNLGYVIVKYGRPKFW